jgi:capsular polysaccharide export protein
LSLPILDQLIRHIYECVNVNRVDNHGSTRRFIARLPGFEALLENRFSDQVVLAWGRKPSAGKAARLAQKRGLSLVQLEDGFLRSFGPGDRFPPLSLVVDETGIYYDSTRPSSLESLLSSDADVLGAQVADVSRARELVVTQRLSKYNHAPNLSLSLRQRIAAQSQGQKRVLVVDQTFGDLSVAYGGASADTFTAMLAAARVENPTATIFVKTHPEVSSGRKRGYLGDVVENAHTVLLRDPVNPYGLLAEMDQVYVVSSTLGFEALLAGKPVTVFGMPWYAGWGVTDDRGADATAFARRTRTRSVLELFAAAYLHYACYLDPITFERGTIFDVIDWLLLQRARQDGVVSDFQ